MGTNPALILRLTWPTFFFFFNYYFKEGSASVLRFPKLFQILCNFKQGYLFVYQERISLYNNSASAYYRVPFPLQPVAYATGISGFLFWTLALHS